MKDVEIGQGKYWLTGGMSPEEILEQLPAAATLCRVGRSKEDLAKPKIAILHAQNYTTPGHFTLLQLAEAVAKGIKDAGGLPIIGSAGVGLCDGILMGHPGMKRSLYSRETNADSIEEMLAHGIYNGAVLLGACDKNIPGYHLGAVRANIPSIFVTPGPMWPGLHNGKKLGIVDSFVSKGERDRGDISRDEADMIVGKCCPGPGSCQGMYTANSMQCLTEGLGMSIKGMGATPAVQSMDSFEVHEEKLRLAYESGKRIVELAKKGITARDIVTEAALINAFILDMAIGASTNTLLHLPAIAREAGYTFNLKRINDIASRIPNLVRIEPSKLDDGTKYWMIDLYEAGGIPAVMKELGDLLNLDVMTVDGRLGDRLEDVVNKNPAVIRTRSNAYSDTGGIGVFYGSLAPEGAVIKLTGLDKKFPDKFEGYAVVFNNEEDARKFIDKKGNVKPGMVIVINYEGLAGGPGMREMLYPTSSLTKTGLDNQVVLLTDGRFSGGTRGPCFGHVTPEGYLGGPIAYVKNGDRIVIDMKARTIDLCVSDAEMAERKRTMPRVEHPAPRGVLARCRREALDGYI